MLAFSTVAATEENKGFLHHDETTVQQDLVDIQPPIFSWALAEPSRTSPRSSTVRLIAIVVSGLLLLTLGGFLLKGPLSQLGRAADGQQVEPNLHSGSDSAPKAEATTGVAEAKTQPIQAIDTAEQELRKLRETRMAASPSDRLTILQLFANREKQYPSDRTTIQGESCDAKSGISIQRAQFRRT